LASITNITSGNAAHVADAAERQLQLVALARQLEDFLLGEAVRVARELLFQRLQRLIEPRWSSSW
jgi:hypothetical protein